MPKTMLDCSQDMMFSSHEELLDANYFKMKYHVPYTLEVAICQIAHFVKTGKLLLYQSNSGKSIYTHCLNIDKYGYPLFVGSSHSTQLWINTDFRGAKPFLGTTFCGQIRRKQK